jgi:hypothetical protein
VNGPAAAGPAADEERLRAMIDGITAGMEREVTLTAGEGSGAASAGADGGGRGDVVLEDGQEELAPGTDSNITLKPIPI